MFEQLLKWQDGRIKKFAKRIFDNNEYELLPVLSDLLEEAGCMDEALIGHGRIATPKWHKPNCGLIKLLLSDDETVQENMLSIVRDHFENWKKSGEV